MSKLLTNTSDLQTVLEALQHKASGGGGGEQATPEISVNQSGLITATAGVKSATYQLAFQPAKTITPSATSQIAVSSGYYTGGDVMVAAVPTQTKSATPTSTTQNVTPDSGKFLSKVTVNGDSNLVAGNIKAGVSIFGVSGSYEASGGGGVVDTSMEDGLISRTLTSYTNSRVTSIGISAFYYCANLTTVSFPAVTTIGGYAFYSCSNLTTVNFPVVTSIGTSAFEYCTNLTTVSFPAAATISSNAFRYCTSLTTVSFPAATNIGSYAFYNCTKLITASFPAATTIGSHAFRYCSNLTTANFPAATTINNSVFCSCHRLSEIYLTGDSVCALSNSNAFSSTPFAGYSAYFSGTPRIYVPRSLVTSYKAAINWTYFSSMIIGLEAGTVGGGDN